MSESPNKHGDSLQRATALRHFLKPLAAYLDDPAVWEVCINRPGEVFTESPAGWVRYECAAIDPTYCEQLVRLMATFGLQAISESSPILSVTLPDGQRCQIVTPPATLAGTWSITIRKPSSVSISLESYKEAGAFDEVTEQSQELQPHENELLTLKANRDYLGFIKSAVHHRQNIIISGATGSGKTTFAKAIIDCVPRDERLISIENVDELKLRNTHENSVALFYSAGGQGLSKATPQLLMQSSLRMKPERVFLAELIAGDEAFYFLDTVSSGHPGSITTMHSETPAMCIERLTSLIRRSHDGRTMSTADIQKMIRMCIDVVIQFKVVNKKRCVTEIYYDPASKKAAMA